MALSVICFYSLTGYLFVSYFIYQNNNETDDEQKVEINPSAYKHGRYEIRTCKHMNKHSLIHQFRDSLRSGKRKHVYRNIDCGLEKDHFHHSGSAQSESEVYHIRQKKHTASLQKSNEHNK